MRKVFKTAALCLGLLFGGSCFAATVDNKETLAIGPYISPVWTDGFVGSFERDFGPTELRVTVRSEEGGFDTAFATNYEATSLVDEVHPNYFVRADYAVSGSGNGYWWVGPKISVAWSDQPGTPGWFENYIIENSSMAPEEFHRRNLDLGATYIGDTWQDAATYRHYRLPFETWTQFIAVRQSYRLGGVVAMKPILTLWRANGLPNEQIDNIRLNVETGGEIDRIFSITDIVLPIDFRADPGFRDPNIGAVPLPAAGQLLICALGGLVALRRRTAGTCKTRAQGALAA